jgi:ribosomal protein L11 methyltransferase
LRARFIELAPAGFEEQELGTEVELAAYGETAMRIRDAFPEARTTEVDDDWEERWREFHHGIMVGPLWVGPPWESPPEDVVAVIIDPARAFGTGAHPTTRLCLELLLEAERGSVLDVGCGSGVLSIAAAKLGHAPVIALDSDEAAVDATRVNAERNGVAVDVRQLDVLEGELPAADLALANIALAPVERLAGELNSPRVVTSGYYAAKMPDLRGYERLQRRTLDGWAADLHERR